MRYPKQLYHGQTIGFVAPSFGAVMEPYASALTSAEEIFEDMGYKYLEYPCARKSDGFGISSDPRTCAREIEEAWQDDRSDVVMSCGGGELMCETISFIDFDKLKNTPPKWFMGYSDNTNLVHLLVTLCDTAAIYGPCAPAFGMHDWHESVSDAFDILAHDIDEDRCLTYHSYDGWQLESLKDEDHPYEPYNIDTPLNMEAYAYADGKYQKVNDVTLEGRLIGGCVDCLSNLVGTKFDKTSDFTKSCEEGVVWMLESCELTPMDMRRSLWQMYMAGWFDNANGFVFGRPDLYGETSFDKDYKQVVLDFFDEFDIHTSCIFDADFGHKPPMIPVIMGSSGKCHFQDNKFSIKMKLD